MDGQVSKSNFEGHRSIFLWLPGRNKTEIGFTDPKQINKVKKWLHSVIDYRDMKDC